MLWSEFWIQSLQLYDPEMKFVKRAQPGFIKKLEACSIKNKTTN
jgi:hypothetical protein